MYVILFQFMGHPKLVIAHCCVCKYGSLTTMSHRVVVERFTITTSFKEFTRTVVLGDLLEPSVQALPHA